MSCDLRSHDVLQEFATCACQENGSPVVYSGPVLSAFLKTGRETDKDRQRDSMISFSSLIVPILALIVHIDLFCFCVNSEYCCIC